MKVIPLEGSALTVPELEELVRQGPVVLTRNGLPLMTVNDATGSDWEAVSVRSDPRFISLIEESRRSYRESGGIALEDVRRELDADPEDDASPTAALGQ
jgi:hypothetical protein